jgi:hypothetical protein
MLLPTLPKAFTSFLSARVPTHVSIRRHNKTTLRYVQLTLSEKLFENASQLRCVQEGDVILVAADVEGAPLTFFDESRSRKRAQVKLKYPEYFGARFGVVEGEDFMLVVSEVAARSLAAEFNLSVAESSAPSKQKSPVYPTLRGWPNLAAPTVVLTNAMQKDCYRLPLRLIRAMGMHPENGVNAALKGSCLLVWGTEDGGPFKKMGVNMTLPSPRSFPVMWPNMSLAVGPNYLIIGPELEIRKFAPGTPVEEYPAWERRNAENVFDVGAPFTLNKEEIVAWSSFTLETELRGSFRTTAIAGRIVALSGFGHGTGVRAYKYANGSVVEACDEEAAHFKMQSGKEQYPEYVRFNAGPTLIDVEGCTNLVYVALTHKRGLLLRPDSPLMALCLKAKEFPKSRVKQLQYISKHPASQKIVLEGRVVQHVLGCATVDPVADGLVKTWANYDCNPGGNGRIQVNGEWLAPLGFKVGARYNIEEMPGSRTRYLAILHAEGKYGVTDMNGKGVPKLYIPNAVLASAAFERVSQVKIIGFPDMLVIGRVSAAKGKRPSASIENRAQTFA